MNQMTFWLLTSRILKIISGQVLSETSLSLEDMIEIKLDIIHSISIYLLKIIIGKIYKRYGLMELDKFFKQKADEIKEMQN